MAAFAALAAPAAMAADPVGASDPPCVVEQWSVVTSSPKIIDINFSDVSWPDTWGDSGTGIQCPEYESGRYVNLVLDVPVNGGDEIMYPVLFHNCTFANKESYNGLAAATAAFSRQYYEGQKSTTYNDWKQPGHTTYLEDNIAYKTQDGKEVPTHGEAGFVQMCRNASADGVTSLHGWMEIDHIPYVDRVQWSWSSTSWGRGIKCDYKVGDSEWQPLVWMGSEKHKSDFTIFSDQGYFMENVIDAHDVSIRWRVWDGDGKLNSPDQVQTAPFSWQAIDPLAQRQAPRVHKIKIYGDEISAEQAAFAKANPVGDVGELTDLSDFGISDGPQAPDADAPVMLLHVNPDGTGDYTTIQAAIDAVPADTRGIIYIAPGVYDENLYAGRKGGKTKFISLIGSDAETTILTSSVSRTSDSGSYNDCAALNVFTPRFYAENLTIRNTSGNVGQAEALYTNGDGHIFKNCIISGYQDTYKANSGSRGYFTGCRIEGAVDFIYDGGLEWFENCCIVSVAPTGYITAPADATLVMTDVKYPLLSTSPFRAGLFFSNCELINGTDATTSNVYLGRPWKEGCGAMMLNCRYDSHIHPAGWSAWNGTENKASLVEYNNVTLNGSPVDVSRRASFSHQATAGEVEAYINPDFLFGEASKVPFDYKAILAGTDAPHDFSVSPAVIHWEGDAAGYIIFRGADAVAMTEETIYRLPEGETAEDYSVASVSRHGVMSAPVAATSATRLTAFPTAEGFGKYATGGRGGEVVKVTSLADDSSEGTLRWAFNQHKGKPITIVFEVSGEIALSSDMRINRANWTLAGQTAPGEGIVITHNKMNFGGSQNFIVRNIRFRIGQKDKAGNILAQNAVGAENCANFIFDHCSFGWSVEENMNTADSHFLTVQYSMVHEGLLNAGHSKGARGYGCQWGGSPATYHHNLLAHNSSRSPRFNGARGEDNVVFIEYINNVNYNYGSRGGCYGGENTANIQNYNGLNSAHDCNFINNYYKAGPYSNTSRVTFVNSSYARSGATSWAPAKWYVAGNVSDRFPSATSDNWTAMEAEHYSLADIRADGRIVTSTPYYKYTVAALIGLYQPEDYMMYDFCSADDALADVIAHAGTVNRDKVESRIASEVANGTATYGGKAGANKGIIDTENDAEGFFAYSSDYIVPADTDGDGMPDEWETANGLDPTAADNNRVNSQGYTALEVYLASLMGEPMLTDFGSNSVATVFGSAVARYDSATEAVLVGSDAIGGLLTVYSPDGKIVNIESIDSEMISLSSIPSGIYLIKVTAPSLAPVILKIRR